ncbi:hypothetical protein Tco_1297729 [Tanacetum coccineum]
MSTPKFAETYNLVAFLEKPKESNRFDGIIDFLNASSIKYALTVNPIVYESCIQLFWATAKAKTIDRERQIQALVDKKKMIITEKSVRSNLMLDDAEGTECLPNDVIFEQLTLMGTMASAIIYLATNQKFNFSKYIFDNMMKNLEGGVKFLMYPKFVQVFLDKQVEGMSTHKGIYVTPSYTKKIFVNIKREGKGFSGRITPLFQTMMVQALEDMGEDSAALTDSHSTPIVTQPSSSKPQKKKSRRKQRKDSGPIEPIPDEDTNEEHVSTPSYDPPQSASRVESSNDVSLGAQEDVSKQWRKIADLDADAEVTLIDETQERNDEEMFIDVQDDLHGEEVVAEKEVAEKEVSAADPVTTAGEVVTTASATTTVDELTLAQTLIEIKEAKPKAVTTAATIITTVVASIRPKAKVIVFYDQEEQAPAFTQIVSFSQASQLPQAKDKGKGKCRVGKERVAQEEASKAKTIEELDSIQVMIEADEQLAARLQAEEQEQFSIEEKSRMLVVMIAERKKFFAA